METIIELENVGLTFRRDGVATEVLRDFTLSVPAGRFVAILGPSGVGKSTLLRVIAGLLQPSSGRVKVKVAHDETRLPVALVFQDARLLPWRKVRDNVSFGLEHGHFRAAERQQKAEDALQLVGLGGFENRYPHELSGGQRQRVSLARALAVEPDVLLMDEPFAALDAITREALQDELTRIHAATGKTILFVTHSIDEAMYLADEIVLITGKPGRLTLSVTVGTERPRKRDAKQTADLANRLRAQMTL